MAATSEHGDGRALLKREDGPIQQALRKHQTRLEACAREGRRCLVVFDWRSDPGRMLVSLDDSDQAENWKRTRPEAGQAPDPETDPFAYRVARAWKGHDVHEMVPIVCLYADYTGPSPHTVLWLCELPWVPAPHAHCEQCGARSSPAEEGHPPQVHTCAEPW